MTTPTARHSELRTLIETHNAAYHGQDAPLITDAQFDALTREARDLERSNPHLKPIDMLGSPASASFEKVPHPSRLYSLDNAFTDDDMQEYGRVLREALGADAAGFTAEPKVDGLSINLIYQNGTLIRALTRGDGFTGEDVTANVLTIPGIPRTVTASGTLEVRGEIYMTTEAFNAYNALAEAEGRPLLSNARNGAAGAIRQKRSADTRDRQLNAVFYGIGLHDPTLNIGTQKQLLDFLTAQGFPTNPLNRTFRTLAEATAYHHELTARRHELPMDADGTVIKLGSLRLREEVGYTSRAPKWATAYKFPSQEVQTVLRGFIFQTGHTGKVTPVADLEPVTVEGSTVSRATLHNEDFILNMDLRAGDTVTFKKSGGVIPKILSVIPYGQPGSLPHPDFTQRSEPFQFPRTCPSCGQPTTREAGQSGTFCRNDACDARAFERIARFGSRKVMNILGLGDSIIQALIEQAGVKTPADLYHLDASAIAGLTTTDENGGVRQVGLKTAQKLTEQINASRTAPLSRVISSFAFSNVGEGTGERVARHYDTLEDVMNATVEDLKRIEDVGDVVARSLHDGLRRPDIIREIDRLRTGGLTPTSERRVTSEHLAGLTFVLTGTLSLSRDVISGHLQQYGAKVTGSVTSKTSYLIAGDGGGGKRANAEKKGVTVLDESGLHDLLTRRGVPLPA